MKVYALFLVLATMGCVEDVAKDKAQATVVDKQPTKEVAETPKADSVTPNTLAVDITKSTISALSAKVTATHPIDFPAFKGSVQYDGDTLTGVSFEIDMAQLQSDNPRLTKHLLNEDFFDVGKYPTSTFKSSSVKTSTTPELGEGTHTVTGDLTIRGTTKTIEFPASIKVTESAFVAESGFAINRQDFGVSYTGRADDLIQDNVALTIQLVAPRK